MLDVNIINNKKDIVLCILLVYWHGANDFDNEENNTFYVIFTQFC